MNASDAVIVADGLMKSFGKTEALRGLNLEVSAGEVHGFLGPNGAGKSTTIRALLGQLRLNAGTLKVFGLDPWADAVAIHHRLAYVPGDVALWPNLTGGEVIDLLLGLRGVPVQDKSRAELIERFDLDPRKKGRTYSKGNRQKVALVAALAGEPELLVLDEPTSGLDPLMEDVFRECVRERVAAGTTVLLSSHILSEVEQLCDRVTIIREGTTVESGSLAELRHLTRTKVHAVTVNPADISAVPGAEDLLVSGMTVSGTVPAHSLGALASALGSAGLTSLETALPSLEELFRDVYAVGESGARRTHRGEEPESPDNPVGGRHRGAPTS